MDSAKANQTSPDDGLDAGRRVMDRLDALAQLSDDPGRITRLYLSPSHGRAVELVSQWMQSAGMSVRLDDAGSLIGRCEAAAQGEGDPAEQRTLLLGSHLDTVRDGGRFDGALGIVTAIEAVDRLAMRGTPLPAAVEVVAFGDEEGVRFPKTLMGSRAMAGDVAADDLSITDDGGKRLEEALLGFGCDPTAIGKAARDPRSLLGYIELHIEQGRRLEEAGMALGVVTGISGAIRAEFTLTGSSGHAGTTTMEERRDALCCAAEMVLCAEDVAVSHDGVHATVGRLDIGDPSVNVIPGKVRFSVDLRCFDETVRARAFEELVERCGIIAGRRGIHIATRTFYDQPSVACDERLMARLSSGIRTVQNGEPMKLVSMAGHDGLAMSKLCPFAMVFVRCRGGLSHHPDEHVSVSDIAASVGVLEHLISHGIDR